jgi:hypothetical protein
MFKSLHEITLQHHHGTKHVFTFNNLIRSFHLRLLVILTYQMSNGTMQRWGGGEPLWFNALTVTL